MTSTHLKTPLQLYIDRYELTMLDVARAAKVLVNDIRSEQVLPSDVSTCPPI